jgi:hypothetical protein
METVHNQEVMGLTLGEGITVSSPGPSSLGNTRIFSNLGFLLQSRSDVKDSRTVTHPWSREGSKKQQHYHATAVTVFNLQFMLQQIGQKSPGDQFDIRLTFLSGTIGRVCPLRAVTQYGNYSITSTNASPLQTPVLHEEFNILAISPPNSE